MIIIDGSYLEGGGQILRTAVALSAITGKSLKVTNIRKGRKIPGLQHQHLTAIEAAARLCNADVRNVKLGSTDIEFLPKEIQGGEYKIDIGTAGSITLVLQTLVPICMFADKETTLEIIGGTDVAWSPTIHDFKNLFLNYLEMLGMQREKDFDLGIEKYGFYPKGGGLVKFMIRPFKNLKELDATQRGKLERIDMISVASESLRSAKVAERQLKGAESLKDIGKKEAIYGQTLSPGSSIHIHAHFDNCKLGASRLGELGKKAELVGEECAALLRKQIDKNACFDEWMADQILPYMALSGNAKSSVAHISDHCKTNMWVIEKFLPPKFNIEGDVIETIRL
jgi:RNA 3'-terminal phosphate cyclase (GTP)